MAEVVEMNIEEMIPELELMEKLQIFDKNEIRNITKKRKDFEYKLQRATKSKEDMLRYIQYEWDLMTVIRRKRAEKGLTAKKNTVGYSVANHINKLFSTAIRRFPAELKIWLAYIKFCKQVRFYSCVSRVFDQLLELHGDKPFLFKLAAQTEFEDLHCVEKARKFLLNGIHLHNDCDDLYKEAFKLELNYANMKRNEIEDGKTISPDDPVLNGKLAQVIYDSAIKKINSVTFVVDLLNIAKQFTFTDTLQNKILEDLTDMFPTEELTWDTVARRKLEPFGSNKNITPKDRIKNCTNVYEKAVKTVDSLLMWSMYIDCMMDLKKDKTILPNLKTNCLTRAFLGAHKADRLSERYYMLWATQLKGEEKTERLYNVLRSGTERIPDSIALWTERLKYHLSMGEITAAHQVFKDGITALEQSPSSPSPFLLWKLMIEYWQVNDTTTLKVEELFKEGISGGNPSKCETAVALKSLYLEWLVLNKGVVAGRKAYFDMSTTPPYSLDLHLKMAALEDIQPNLSVKNLRKCHQLAVHQFGVRNTDVWMSYIKFEQNHGDARIVPDIYNKALKTLHSDVVDIFISEFSLSKAEAFTLGPLRKVKMSAESESLKESQDSEGNDPSMVLDLPNDDDDEPMEI